MKSPFIYLVTTVLSIYNEEHYFTNKCNQKKYLKFYKKEIDHLISKMTLREKIGQLTQINIGDCINKETNEINLDKLKYYIIDKKVGSFLNNLSDGQERAPGSKEKWIKAMNLIQTLVKETRLKIPIVYGLDSVHGANYILNATLFPQQLGLASSFNLSNAVKAGEITAKDMRAVGVHWNFSPILDIAVNKQWPRTYETFGEDPYTVSEFGKAIIYGYQGSNCKLDQWKVAATMKHFIGYSGSRSGHDVDGSWIGDRALNDYFRPSFQKASDFGALTAMESYSDIDGDHLVNSKKYLVELLRNEMKFGGILVTDWAQIEKLHKPIYIAETDKEAVKLSWSLGSIDMSMVPNNAKFIDYLEELINEGQISETLIDQNVRRVLILKKKLGLLNHNGLVDPDNKMVNTIGSKEDNEASLNAAREGIILLKNDLNFLPLKIDSKILIVGPTANNLRYLTGGWTFQWPGPNSDEWFYDRGTTIYQALNKLMPNVEYMDSIDIEGNQLSKFNLDELIFKAKGSDALIVCLGEKNYVEFLGNIHDMNLPKGQNDLLEQLTSLNKPVILILNEGRPRVVSNAHKNCTSILLNLLNGPHSGQAIAEILIGKINPSGKLPITYSNRGNDNTLNYYRRRNEIYEPEWQFGHGLSYSKFVYSNLKLSNIFLRSNTAIWVEVDITNESDRIGKEVVFLFIRDDFRSISPEAQLLKKFKKVEIHPNQTVKVRFHIRLKDLAFHNIHNERVVERGTFTILMAGHEKQFFLLLDKKLQLKIDDY